MTDQIMNEGEDFVKSWLLIVRALGGGLWTDCYCQLRKEKARFAAGSNLVDANQWWIIHGARFLRGYAWLRRSERTDRVVGIFTCSDEALRDVPHASFILDIAPATITSAYEDVLPAPQGVETLEPRSTANPDVHVAIHPGLIRRVIVRSWRTSERCGGRLLCGG